MSIAPNSTVHFTGGIPPHVGRHATVIGAYISTFYVPELGLDTRGEVLLAVRFLDGAAELATDIPETDVEVMEVPNCMGVPIYLSDDDVEALYVQERGISTQRMACEGSAYEAHPSQQSRDHEKRSA